MPKVSKLGAATVAALKTLLGLGTAAYTASTAYDAVGTAAGLMAGKANKIAASPSPAGHVAGFTADGDLVDLGAPPIASSDFTDIVSLTQAEYDALSPVDADTLYIIIAEA